MCHSIIYFRISGERNRKVVDAIINQIGSNYTEHQIRGIYSYCISSLMWILQLLYRWLPNIPKEFA